MKDLSFSWDDAQQCFDIDFASTRGAEIKRDGTLKTAVSLSLFSDSRCEDFELPSGEIIKRGFWADVLDGLNTGSKLWLLDRSKKTNDLLKKTNNYVLQALQWLMDEKWVQTVGVNSYFNGNILVIPIVLDNSKLDYRVRIE